MENDQPDQDDIEFMRFWQRHIASALWAELTFKEQVEAKCAAVCAFRAGWAAAQASAPPDRGERLRDAPADR